MPVQPAAMRRLMREISEMQRSPPEGIRIQTSEDNMLDVVGIIQGPEGTPYSGGYFKVKFNFTEEFPQAPPKCRFITKIFHPNVSGAGEICVNTLKKDWQASFGIAHILVTVKCLLIYPNPESALDEEAGKLLLENYKTYCDRAKLITSVHATPRVRPVEFDIPSKEEQEAQKEKASSSTSSDEKKPTSASSKPPSSASLNTPPTTLPIGPRKSGSPGLTTQTVPLKSSPSNLGPEKDSGGKERHTSPAPLGTADANVESKVPTSNTVQPASKAVKRAAAGSGGAAEKRKKALKRL